MRVRVRGSNEPDGVVVLARRLAVDHNVAHLARIRVRVRVGVGVKLLLHTLSLSSTRGPSEK